MGITVLVFAAALVVAGVLAPIVGGSIFLVGTAVCWLFAAVIVVVDRMVARGRSEPEERVNDRLMGVPDPDR